MAVRCCGTCGFWGESGICVNQGTVFMGEFTAYWHRPCRGYEPGVERRDERPDSVMMARRITAIRNLSLDLFDAAHDVHLSDDAMKYIDGQIEKALAAVDKAILRVRQDREKRHG